MLHHTVCMELSHKSAESDPDMRDARGGQALITQKLVSEMGINGEGKQRVKHKCGVPA